MKRPLTIIILAGLALLIILAAFRQIQRSRTAPAPSLTDLQAEMGVPVEVAQAHMDTFALSRNYLGVVEGGLQGDVVASIQEQITEIPVEVGQRVQRGQVVARLDTRAAQAQFNQARLAFDDAERELQRMENLYEAGAVSQQMLDRARLARDVARQNLESSSQVVALTAPIDGVVTDVFYRRGETVRPGDPVVRVADLRSVKVRFDVNFEDRRLMERTTPTFIRVSGDGVREIPADITDISLSADRDTRLFTIWAQAENDEVRLQPGMLVDVRAVVVQKPNTLVVNRDAVLTRNDRRGVFVVNEQGLANFQPLELGQGNADQVEVLGGLQSGQTVVVYGQNNLNDGDKVNIVQSQQSLSQG
ncbi:MAG: efflux RND transporter periplasmic adaptor subunit [Candidatus Zixiibacteriota bacterium]|nr:MAG: efflux RND transporter periplasmic adaptor subunit [candidate division Zixibacteria bacterium]